MKSKKGLIILILAMVIVIGAAAVMYDRLIAGAPADQITVQEEPGKLENKAEDEAHEPVKAPDFTVYTADGTAVKLSDFEGRPVVLNFWASWCPPCKSEMPDFDTAYKEHGENIEFLIVNLTDGGRETQESASEYIESHGYSFPVYYDTTLEAAYTYGVYSIPTTYFIDAQGNFTAYGTGALTMDSIQKGISMITK